MRETGNKQIVGKIGNIVDRIFLGKKSFKLEGQVYISMQKI